MSRRSNNVFATIQHSVQPQSAPPAVRDLFLHSLFGRLALTDNRTVELETTFDQATQVVDVTIPPYAAAAFDQVLGMQRGANLKAFIGWLIGSQTLTPTGLAIDQNFISALSMRIWLGANIFNFNGEYLATVLPTFIQSVIGYTLQLTVQPVPTTLRIHLIWSLPGSDLAADFSIRTTATVNQLDGSTPLFYTADAVISDILTNQGDMIQTEIMEVPITSGGLVGLLFSRNFDLSQDPNTQAIVLLGIRVEFDAN